MKIFDKASWQIDNGMDELIVVSHFEFVFNWLNKHEMLSPEGLEILDLGIGKDVSLHERLVNKSGLKFLNEHYDKMITDFKYNVESEKEFLEKIF